MNIIFFDVETNSLPSNYKAHPTDVDCWPRVISIAWQISTFPDERLLHTHCELVLPQNWEIPKEKFWIDNGYSTERNLEYGKPMAGLLDLFIHHLEDCELLVAHNISFDHSVLCAEMVRYNKRSSRKVERFCTMESTVNLCRIPFGRDRRPWKNKNYKFPKLTELYHFLFKEDVQGAHSADADVNAVRLCFFELVKRGVFNIQKPETNIVEQI